MAKVVVGEYATITKGGEFDGHKVNPGDRAKVMEFHEHYSTNNKKVWATVDLVGTAGNVYARIKMPSWWLRPRSILDDLAEA
jgi:hypothetical protein